MLVRVFVAQIWLEFVCNSYTASPRLSTARTHTQISISKMLNKSRKKGIRFSSKSKMNVRDKRAHTQSIPKQEHIFQKFNKNGACESKAERESERRRERER